MANRLAVLIDAENVPAKHVDFLFDEIAKLGTATVKRIYGDWTLPILGGWKKTVISHALLPVQQFHVTSGKNATDCALIIDAMDLLYTRNFQGFCIVSSDSDFTRLACRIRESGLNVYGFGEEKTPESFVQACDRFIKLNSLVDCDAAKAVATPNQPGSPKVKTTTPAKKPPESAKATTPAKKPQKSAKSTAPAKKPQESAKATASEKKPPETAKASDPKNGKAAATNPGSSGSKISVNQELIKLTKSAYDSIPKVDGWAALETFSNKLLKLSPSFKCKDYGTRKLSNLAANIDAFATKTTPNPKKPKILNWYIKLK